MIQSYAREGDTVGAVLRLDPQVAWERPLVGGAATREAIGNDPVARVERGYVDVEIVSAPSEADVRRWMLEHQTERDNATSLAEAAAEHFDHHEGEDDWLSDELHFVWTIAAEVSPIEEDILDHRLARRADEDREAEEEEARPS